MRQKLPPLPEPAYVENYMTNPPRLAAKHYFDSHMTDYGRVCWNAAISAALECSGDSVINGFIEELYLQAETTASSSPT